MIRIAPTSALVTSCTTARAGARRSFLAGLVGRLLNADRHYREMRALEDLDADRLADIGVDQEAFDTAFRTRYGRRRDRTGRADFHERFPS